MAPFASTQRFEVEESERVVLAGGTGRPDPYVLADAITAIEQSRRLATEESSETAARQLALMLSEADLATAVRSSESLGGKAYLLRRPELAKAGFLAQRRAQLVLIRAARSRLCATVSCEITDYAGATSDPSTAKP